MPSIPQFFSLAVFTLGAPAFSVLAVFYLRQGGKGLSLFRIFTIVCAGAFLANLGSALLFLDGPFYRLLEASLVSLLPPMMLHVAIGAGRRATSGDGLLRRAVLGLVYAAAMVCAFGRELSWSDAFDNSAAIVLGAAAFFGLAGTLLPWPAHPRLRDPQRRWTLAIFGALLACAIAALLSDNQAFDLAPDYLLLAFFATQLYYAERLAFFDVFLRGGAYFSAGAVLLALLLAALPVSRNALGGDWTHIWLAALALMPVWLIGPLVYRRLSLWIDLRALHRRYSRADAERVFTQAVQTAGAEEQLRGQAIRALEDIFNCRADIDFDRAASSVDPGDLLTAIPPAGSIHLHARDNQSAFLSDERSLLQAFAGTLGILLQDVRFRRLREDQLVREQDLRALAGRAELRALRAQINPHFLFNALNSVAGCIRARPEVADETLAQLAGVFRYTLSRSGEEWVRLSEEIDFIRSYLAVEQTRFGDRLHAAIRCDAAAAAVSIPAMIVQPLVENAIKHGASQVTGIGEIAIDIVLSAGALRIGVSDNGPGFPGGFTLADASAGHGLRNVAERLHGYYGARGVLRWENSSMGHGATVTIEIPLETLPQCAS